MNLPQVMALKHVKYHVGNTCKNHFQILKKKKSLRLQADSLPAEPQGKPKNTGVGSLFLLLNQDLLHCRWILFQLSYQGSPLLIFSLDYN